MAPIYLYNIRSVGDEISLSVSAIVVIWAGQRYFSLVKATNNVIKPLAYFPSLSICHFNWNIVNQTNCWYSLI